MKSENKKGSIFNIDFLMNESRKSNIFEDIEMLSVNLNSKTKHVLSKNIELSSIALPKNDMINLVKSGYSLPEVDTPQRMLVSLDGTKQIQTENKTANNSPYRMVNLISESFKLPDIETENWLK